MQLTPILMLFTILKATKIDAMKNLKSFKQTHCDTQIHRDVGQMKEHLYKYPFVSLKESNLSNKAALRTRIVKRSNEIYAKVPDKHIDKPVGFLSPRDKLVYETRYKQDKYDVEESLQYNYASRNFTRMNYDFESLLDRNLANANPKGLVNSKPRPKNSDDPEPNTRKAEHFESNTFFLKSMVPKEFNWTTCAEFAKRALFHPNDIVDIVWIPFYVWSTHGPRTALLHKFVYPTKKRVRQYKENYGKYVVNVDWKQPKLLMSTNIEMLLVAGDRRGLFYGIPDAKLPSSITTMNMTLPAVKMRIKILDPYLAMMYCEERYAVIMAIQGEDPVTDEDKEKEAAILKFRGHGRTMFRNIELEEQIKEAAIQRKALEDRAKFLRVELQRVNNPDALITRV